MGSADQVSLVRLDLDLHSNSPNVHKHDKEENKDKWRGSQVCQLPICAPESRVVPESHSIVAGVSACRSESQSRESSASSSGIRCGAQQGAQRRCVCSAVYERGAVR